MVHTKFQGLGIRYLRIKFSKVFTMYGHGGHLDHVTQIPWTNFHFSHSTRSRSTKGHHLNKFHRAWILNAVYQVSRFSSIRFLRRKVSKVFTIYGHGQVTQTLWTNFCSPTHGDLTCNLAKQFQKCRLKMLTMQTMGKGELKLGDSDHWSDRVTLFYVMVFNFKHY